MSDFILPGATLGMLGGGQLGRMFTIAARSMGYHVTVLDPDPHSPAGLIADDHLQAGYTDEVALLKLAQASDVVTTEFENIPAQTLALLEQHCPVRPSSRAVELTQDRIREKTFIDKTGLATAAFKVIERERDLEPAFAALQAPLILKRSALGYDGKGQVPVTSMEELHAAFAALEGVPCVLEQRVDLACEISVVLARSLDGETVCFPVAENEHKNGILDVSIVPARVDEALAERARDMAQQLADALDYCGVMAVEFFVTKSGDLLVNEIAPRPHNSGHYTRDACVTSQFEQQVRMVCGLRAGAVDLLSPVVMVNLLGDLWHPDTPDWSKLLAQPAAKLHLYGKREARPGRKMGHFCYLHEDIEVAVTTARELFADLDQ